MSKSPNRRGEKLGKEKQYWKSLEYYQVRRNNTNKSPNEEEQGWARVNGGSRPALSRSVSERRRHVLSCDDV